MKIVMANDHAAITLKNQLRMWLEENGHEVKDLGVGPDAEADYPDKGVEAALEYKKGGYDYGVVLCGTGIGISIAVNKVKGLRCALPQNLFAAAAAREHNDCQFLALGGRIDYPDAPTDMLAAFIGMKFHRAERHRRRVNKIMAIEE